MKKLTLTTLLTSLFILSTNTVFAQNISYTAINKKDFLQRWKIEESEFERYKKVMETEGKYRYPNLTPYEVLGITSDNEAQMLLYAKKAAEDEMKAVDAQIKFAIKTTEFKKAIETKKKKSK